MTQHANLEEHDKPKKFKSSLGIKYPTLRDDPLKTGVRWLEGKRADDNAEGLWRIHDRLYDLDQFIDKHPGGRDWIQLTKGTDITEAFETHHLTPAPERLLENYFVRQSNLPRNSPFTFKDDGFYKTLKRRIVAKLPEVPKEPIERSKRIADSLVVAYVLLAVAAAIWRSFTCGLLAGIVLSLNAIAAHNFFHQKDNFRMYYFNLTLMEYRDWRISHALSHHLHTNTINDLEISTLEPFFEYLPGPKLAVENIVKILIWPVVCCALFFGSYVRSIADILMRRTSYTTLIFLPFLVVLLMVLVSSGDLVFSSIMFLWIQLVGSLHFSVVGLNAAHHHPDIFHDGDAPRPNHELDWGVHEIDAVMDRKDITGSHFLVLTNFGDHALHHLFPTIDHGLLEYLYPTFLKTCHEFGIEWRLLSQIDLVKGQFQQLVKIQPKLEPPKPLKRILEWRIIHALSHHLHTNTINDFEITALEPFIEYLPGEKNFAKRLVQVVIAPFVYLFISTGSFVRRVAEIVLGKNGFKKSILLPFLLLIPMTAASSSVLLTTVMFIWIQLIASLHFGAVGLNGGHHHPEIFHDGDAPRSKNEMDWGIFQLDAVMDRKSNTSSHFWVLTNFGNHSLHHMFPTIDHGLLEYLYPTYLKTCADFGAQWRLAERVELVKGQFQQIVKSEPNCVPPRPLRLIKCT